MLTPKHVLTKKKWYQFENNNMDYYYCFRKNFGPSLFWTRSVGYAQYRLSGLTLLSIKSE